MKVYNDYALIEWHKGNKDTSGGIFAAALGMRSSLPDLYILILILDDALIDKTTRPFRPGLLRQLMTNSLELFHQNSIFLSFYAWHESRLRIYDCVPTILRDIVLTPANDNIISRLFAIRIEFRCGTVHSAYSAFENALASPACCANAGLWRLYIRFCLQTKEYRRDILSTEASMLAHGQNHFI